MSIFKVLSDTTFFFLPSVSAQFSRGRENKADREEEHAQSAS